MDSPIILGMDCSISGNRIHLYVSSDFEDRHLWNVSYHCNAEYEVHVILSGNCNLMLNDNPYSLTPATAALIAPKVFHSPSKVSENFCRLSFNFTMGDSPLAELLSKNNGYFLCALPPHAMELCQDILAELSNQLPFREDALIGLFTQLLVQLFRSIQMDQQSLNTMDASTSSLRTATIDKFFNPFPHAFGTQEKLAQLLHISRRHLNRVLRQHYGMNYREKMLQARMEGAGWLLQTTDKKISEIGIMVGYTAESSFFKAFRTYYKMTPQEYRKKYTEKED